MAKVKAVTLLLVVVVVVLWTGSLPVHADLVISEFLANPAGTDSPHEYVELVATRDIDFSLMPYSVVFANNGTATAEGWVAGEGKTYGFSISVGTVSRGDVVYVGGSAAQPIVGGGFVLRAINTGTTDGDAIGGSSGSGVLGNGGGNADGIAVFNVAAGSITSATVPVDAIFFGDAVGSAFVSATEGFMLPSNDRYGGGRLQLDSFLLASAGSGQGGILDGAFDPASQSWLSARTVTYTTETPAIGTTSLTLNPVPEPNAWLLALLGTVGLLLSFRRKPVGAS